MPTLPSLSSAFSALTKAAPLSIGSMSMSTPSTLGVPAFNASAPATPKISTPAVPSLTNLSMSTQTSTPATLGAKQPIVSGSSTPTIPSLSMFSGTTQPKTTTPAASSPVVPSIGSSTAGSSYVRTPSGAMVDPNTGTLVSPGPASAQPLASMTTDSSVTADNTPAVPQAYSSYSGYGGGTPGSFNPLITSQAAENAFGQYENSLMPSQAELDAMDKLQKLNASASQAFVNTENQPIALDFITGQKAALQRSQNALAAPLEAQLNIAQAKRQLAMTASKAALDREQAKVDAYRDLATKTASTAMGSTLSRFNPATGQYETVVNPFGTASGNGGSATDLIGQAVADGRLTSDMVTRYGIPFLLSTLQKDPGYNFVTQKASVAADSSSLKTQQEYADTTSRAYQTATANLNVLNQLVQSSGLNQSNVPLINQLTNKVKSGLTDPGSVAAFQTALTGLRTEYAQVLSRGGQVTDTARNEANALIPDNISPAQLQKVITTLQSEGANAVKEANDKVAEIKGRIGKSGSSQSTSTSNGSVPQGWSW